jgi:hypothetical protein
MMEGPMSEKPQNESQTILSMLRLAKLQNLSPETRQIISAHVQDLSQTNWDEPAPPTIHPLQTPTCLGLSSLQIQLRQQIQGGAGWQAIRSIVEQILDLDPSPSHCAMFLELSLLHGGPLDACQSIHSCFHRAGGKAEFLKLVHPQVRSKLLYACHPDSLRILDQFYQSHAVAPSTATVAFALSELTPFEMLYGVFISKLQSQRDSLMQHVSLVPTESLCNAIDVLPPKLACTTRDQFLKSVASTLLRHGYRSVAEVIGGKITAMSDESIAFEDSLIQQLGKTQHSDPDTDEKKDEKSALLSEDQIAIFNQILSSSQTLNGHQKRQIALAIQNFSNNQYKPSVKFSLSEFIVKHCRSLSEFTDVFTCFHKDEEQFNDRFEPFSIWTPWLTGSDNHDPAHFFSGIAHLKAYIASTDQSEYHLWQSHSQYYEISSKSGNISHARFRECVSAAKTFLKSAYSHQSKTQKQAKLNALELAFSGTILVNPVVENYLSTSSQYNINYLSKLYDLLQSTGQHREALEILTYIAPRVPLSLGQLDMMWKHALVTKNYDLAWRTATIVMAREEISPEIEKLWNVCGENRKNYLSPNLEKHDFDIATFGFNAKTKQLLRALFDINCKLLEFLALNQSSGFARNGNITDIIGMSGFKDAQRQLEKTFISFSIKLTLTINHSGVEPKDAYALRACSSHNVWALLALQILESSSGKHWQYRAKDLQSMITNVLPQLGRADGFRNGAKIGAWLSSFTSKERTAWNELNHILAAFTEPDLFPCLLKFSLRMALLAHPGHFTALSSMRKSKFSMDLITDLEGFILSKSYAHFRKSKGIELKTPVASNVHKIPIGKDMLT